MIGNLIDKTLVGFLVASDQTEIISKRCCNKHDTIEVIAVFGVADEILNDGVKTKDKDERGERVALENAFVKFKLV